MKDSPFRPEPEELDRTRRVRKTSDREQQSPRATKNLVLGLVCVLVGIPAAGVACSWAGRETFVALATGALLAVLVFLATQLRLFWQRNGLFLVLSLGLLVMVFVPVGARLVYEGPRIARLLVGLEQFKRELDVSESTGSAPSGTGAVAANGVGKAPGGMTSPGSQAQIPSFSVPNTLLPGAAGVAESAAASELSNTKSLVGGGGAQGGDKAVEKAGRTSVDSGLSQGNVAHADEDPLQRATRLAQEEAVRRYPSLGVLGSAEHARYIEAYNELARLRKFEFFKDPQWPLRIADKLALQEGWTRSVEASTNADTRAAGVAGEKSVPGANPTKGTVSGVSVAGGGEELALDGPNASVPADPVAQATNRARIEVLRRYPALGNQGSEEYRVYAAAFQELEKLRPDYFEKPEWPLHLAEMVARREGWRRQDVGPATANGGRGGGEAALTR